MLIDTRSGNFKITNPGGNSTASSIAYPAPALVSPDLAAALSGVGAIGDGVIRTGAGGSLCPNGLLLVPYGAGSSTNTFLMNVYGWRSTFGAMPGITPLWVAYELATFTCTLGTVPGLVNCDVNASQLFCGTIALGVGNANISNEVLSPTGNTVAHIVLDTKGSQFVSILFSTNSSATSMNCLAAAL